LPNVEVKDFAGMLHAQYKGYRLSIDECLFSSAVDMPQILNNAQSKFIAEVF